jgi:hypothetical protein
MPFAKALDKKWLLRELERDRKKKAREKIASLAEQLREARRRRKVALREAKERCRAERIAARERARAMRLRVLEELREAMRAERLGARQECTVRLGEARGIKDSILRARAELQAEKKYEAELRRIERANRQRRGADFLITAEIPETDQPLPKQPSIMEMKAYRDTWGVSPEERARGVTHKDKYLRWFSDTAFLLRDLLADTGLLFVHLDDNVGHEAKVVLDEVFGSDRFRGEIIWQLGTGAKSRKFFSIQHNIILVYSGGETWTFNHEEKIAREPFAEGSLATHFRHIDQDGRRYRVRTVNGKDYRYYADEGRLIGSVWTDISSMTANSPIIDEGTGYPTQKPEKLLERIIGVCSQKDQLVLDCFCGSGTAAVAAEKLGRRWIACDLSRFAVHTTRKRLLALPGVKPFVVQNLGKYERRAWAAAEFTADHEARENAYRSFILRLFHAKACHGPGAGPSVDRCDHREPGVDVVGGRRTRRGVRARGRCGRTRARRAHPDRECERHGPADATQFNAVGGVREHGGPGRQKLIRRITKRGSRRMTRITHAQGDGVYKRALPRSIARTTSCATRSGSPAKGGGFRPAVMPVFTKPGLTHRTDSRAA